MNKLNKYTTIGALALTVLTGCKKENNSYVEEKMLEAKGYDVAAYLPGAGDTILIIGKRDEEWSKKSKNRAGQWMFCSKERLVGTDFEGDGRIDLIGVYTPKGSPLEELASVDKLGEILKKVQERHPQKNTMVWYMRRSEWL